MIYFYCFTVFLLVLASAKNDSNKILENKTIDHIQNSYRYTIQCMEASMAFYLLSLIENETNFIFWIIKTGVMAAVTRAAFFDFALNLFRKLPIGYISKKADGVYTGTKESKYDDFLAKIGVNANIIRIVFIILFVVSLFLL